MQSIKLTVALIQKLSNRNVFLFSGKGRRSFRKFFQNWLFELISVHDSTEKDKKCRPETITAYNCSISNHFNNPAASAMLLRFKNEFENVIESYTLMRE